MEFPGHSTLNYKPRPERMLRVRIARESAIDDFKRMRTHERWRDQSYCDRNPFLTHAQSVAASIRERVQLFTELGSDLAAEAIY